MRDTELMKLYEEETGNLAVKDGEVTTEFKKWRKNRIKEREREKRKQELIKVEKQREVKEEFEENCVKIHMGRDIWVGFQVIFS
ncbi:MAG: hypothetical protein EU547_01490 [Promethearchaeota archaeon]|nr:MAG: hypothetical protein EU547_01490 [Candidatus Lokiarchaeota archaeon]